MKIFVFYSRMSVYLDVVITVNIALSGFIPLLLLYKSLFVFGSVNQLLCYKVSRPVWN